MDYEDDPEPHNRAAAEWKKAYDGATTALHRRIEALEAKLLEACGLASERGMRMQRTWAWSRRWKALAKCYRESNAYYYDKADELESRIDTAMAAIRQRPTQARIWKALAKKLRQTVKNWEDTHHVEMGNLKFRLSMVTADPESLASQLLSKHNALMMASGNLAVQNKRIEELTAELADAKGTISLQDAVLRAADKREATERAAREQAEKDHGEAQNRLYFVERERDTALARVKSLEKQAREHEQRWLLAERDGMAAETALASARRAIEGQIAGTEDMLLVKGEHTVVSARACVDDLRDLLKALLTSHPSPAPVATSGRVEELERAAERATQLRALFDKLETLLDRWTERNCEASNLATACLELLHTYPSTAPVAAPCAGCEAAQAELERRTAWSNGQMAELQKNYDACHRQHEQCMKLLQKCDYFLQTFGMEADGELRSLIRTMLSKGELPEGWDELNAHGVPKGENDPGLPEGTPCSQCTETKKKLLEALRRLGDSGDYISFRARITEAAR